MFKSVVKEILQDSPHLGDSGSEVSHFISEPRNLSEGTIFSDDIKKPWIKATQKETKNIINNQTYIVQEPEKGAPITPCMDVYRSKI